MIKDGGSAFPRPLGGADRSDPAESGGMTLRDYFAGQALAAIIASEPVVPRKVAEFPYTADKARMAYRYADAMLKAREEAS